jgi:transposase
MGGKPIEERRELEAKLGRSPKTPDNSSLPPSRRQKANAEPPVKPQRKGRPGIARKLAEKPDATRRFCAEHCPCGAVLGQAGQELAKECDHIDIPPIRPITTRVELFRNGAQSYDAAFSSTVRSLPPKRDRHEN